MWRKSVTALVGLMLLAGVSLARDVTGKIVKVDAKAVTVETEDGKKTEYLAAPDLKVLDAKGTASKDGLKDKRLVAGTSVMLVLPTTAKTFKELHLVAATVPATKEPPKGVKGTPPKETPKEVKGTSAKIVKVDADKRTVQVQTEDGKKMEYRLGDDVQFIGPRGGVSDKGIKDDRFVAGSEITIVLDAGAKNVKEIHLATRKSEPKEEKKEK